MKKLFALTIALTMTFLSACGSATTPSSNTGTSNPSSSITSDSSAPTENDSGKKTNIRMWTFLDPGGTSGREIALKEMISAFESENPEYKIVVEPQTWDVMTGKFFAAHSSGEAPDIMWVLMDELGAAIQLEALEPFENLFLKDWSDEEIADVDDAFWQLGSQDGKHYQMSLSRNYFGIIYRSDLFENKNIAVPKTWDELVAAGKQLTEIDEETGLQRYGLGLALSADKADAQVAAGALLDQQGTLFDQEGKASWNNEAGRKAFGLQLDMIQTYGITPETALTTTPEDLYADFNTGKYAMIVGAGVRVSKLQSEVTFDPESVQFMLMPGFSEGKPSPMPIAGWCVGVWSGSKVKEGAGKFVEYMTNPESDALWVIKGGQAPVRKSTLESQSDFFKERKNNYLGVMAEGFSVAGWPQPTNFKISGWRIDLNNVCQNALANGMSLDDALALTEQEFNERNAE